MQGSKHVKPTARAEHMRDCLRSLKKNHKVTIVIWLCLNHLVVTFWVSRVLKNKNIYIWYGRTIMLEFIKPSPLLLSTCGRSPRIQRRRSSERFDSVTSTSRYNQKPTTSPSYTANKYSWETRAVLSCDLQQDRVGRLKGGVEFLELCGFEKVEWGDKYLYLPRDKVDSTVLNAALSQLYSAMENPFFGVL